MAKFSGGTYKDGVLSYVYEAKPGGRKNNINIKHIKGKWFFVDEEGKVKNKLANGGELSKTHIANLKGVPGSSEENIFASANVSSETGKISTNVDTGGSGVNTTPQGDLSGPIQRNTLAESNYSLPQTQGVRPAPQISSNTQATVVPQVAPDRTISGARSSFSDMASGNAASVSPASDGTFTTSNFGGGRQMGISSNTQGVVVPNQTAPAVSNNPSSTWASMANADPMAVDLKQEDYGSTFQPTNVYAVDDYGGTSGDSNWSSGAVGGFSPPSDGASPSDMSIDAMQEGTTTPGIGDQNDSPWGTTAGWNAAGSVMKGVGGLASAYTGIKNYQLARDAHNTQKNQWQANYNQRLKAYEDNKKLTNEEIRAKNRTREARGQEAVYQTI